MPDNLPLTPREHVRLRPAMYIGGTDKRALHHLIYEVVAYAVDGYFAGDCDHIWITLRPDNEVSIRDNGFSISPQPITAGEKGWLEILLTQPGAINSARFKAQHPDITLYSVGLAAVNALSASLMVEIKHDGFIWQQEYRAGIPLNEIQQLRPMLPDELTGTTITFKPDFTILEMNDFDYDRLKSRSREITSLLGNLSITLLDERDKVIQEEVFFSPDGITKLLAFHNKDRAILHPPVAANREIVVRSEKMPDYKVRVDFAFQYTDAFDAKVLSFLNTVPISNDGAHVLAMRSAIANVLYSVAKYDLDDDEPEFSVHESCAGLTAIISILHPNPSFESPTKLHLMVPAELYGGVSEVVYRVFDSFLRKNPKFADQIIQKCLSNREYLRK